MYDRKAWLSLMATCDKERISSLWQDSQINVDFGLIRDAEVGAVMVKARQGSTGDAFHFSEMSLTRCSVRLASGEIGHGYIRAVQSRLQRLLPYVMHWLRPRLILKLKKKYLIL